MNNSQKILQVNGSDRGGGAYQVAWNLHRMYRKRGLDSWLAVGCKRSNDPSVLTINNRAFYSKWAKSWLRINDFSSSLFRGWEGRRLQKILEYIGQPRFLIDTLRGHEYFEFLGTRHILSLAPYKPDILHCHNLHSGYFDLRALPWLSNQVPTVLTLHDAWLFSGHCAHSFECTRWKTGCEYCHDLKIYPAIRRDSSAYNWKRKSEIYLNSRLFIATPSKWLMHKAKQSMLYPAIMDCRVIPNGVDLSIFHPGDKEVERKKLGLPNDLTILLFSANRIKRNPWKDYRMLENTVMKLAKHMRALFIALGESGKSKQIDQVEIRFIPFNDDPHVVASFYRAADIYIHPSRIDSFPSTIIEAMACGKPVVATAVGGIPEQIQDGETGRLVPAGDSDIMAQRVLELASNPDFLNRIGEKASIWARKYFDLNEQANKYLSWYKEIAARSKSEAIREN